MENSKETSNLRTRNFPGIPFVDSVIGKRVPSVKLMANMLSKAPIQPIKESRSAVCYLKTKPTRKRVMVSQWASSQHGHYLT